MENYFKRESGKIIKCAKYANIVRNTTHHIYACTLYTKNSTQYTTLECLINIITRELNLYRCRLYAYVNIEYLQHSEKVKKIDTKTLVKYFLTPLLVPDTIKII